MAWVVPDAKTALWLTHPNRCALARDSGPAQCNASERVANACGKQAHVSPVLAPREIKNTCPSHFRLPRQNVRVPGRTLHHYPLTGTPYCDTAHGKIPHVNNPSFPVALSIKSPEYTFSIQIWRQWPVTTRYTGYCCIEVCVNTRINRRQTAAGVMDFSVSPGGTRVRKRCSEEPSYHLVRVSKKRIICARFQIRLILTQISAKGN